jgi:hypothetical protein
MLLYAFGFLMNGIPDPDNHFFSGFFNQYPTYLVLLIQSLFGVTISAVYKGCDALHGTV